MEGGWRSLPVYLGFALSVFAQVPSPVDPWRLSIWSLSSRERRGGVEGVR